jgi:hypothetical protein
MTQVVGRMRVSSVQPLETAASDAGARVRRSTMLAFASLYLLIIIVLWSSSPAQNWARGDSEIYHFPIINYFITHGFDRNYPADLIAMFPGMHAYFAWVARLWGLTSLRFNSLTAFLIQSEFGLLLLWALVRLAQQAAGARLAVAVLALPVLSSSYLMYSWVWPTTDLGSMAFYAWMLVLLLQNPVPSLKIITLFSVLTALAMLFRQSAAVLSVCPLACACVDAWVKGQPLPRPYAIIRLMLPVAVGVAGLFWLFVTWGALVPPGFQRHEAAGISVGSAVHIIALSGLIGFPAVPALTHSLRAQRRTLLWIGAVALAIALLCCLTVPLQFNVSAGRYNSLVWNLERPLARFHLGTAFVAALILAGAFEWLCVAVHLRRLSGAPVEIVMFAVFCVSLLVQRMAWQRYLEPELLLTLGVYLARRELSPTYAWPIIGAYSAYAAIAILHAYLTYAPFRI